MECVQCNKPGGEYERHFLCVECYPKAVDIIKTSKPCPYCGSSKIMWVSRIDDHPTYGDVSMMDCRTCNATGPLVTGGVGAAVLFWGMRNRKPAELNGQMRRYAIDWDRVDEPGFMIAPPGVKPCAHCGSTSIRLRRLHDEPLEVWLMVCLNCGSSGPRPDEDCVCTAPTSLKWWNGRSKA